MTDSKQWQAVCTKADLVPDSGIAVWTEQGPVAVFWVPDVEPGLFALGHYDPIGRANVLARGIVGDIKGEPVVASPLYKQHYSLRTGQCLEDEQARVPVYPVRLAGDRLEIDLAGQPPSEQAA
ncbi:MAG: nitrite reductase small subunit NirD [Marinobacter sp.]|uniref:nitrite reductase small subunit NirD n=1 Tax=Marinobacter sp. TaxID=50741 RepID=UPI00299D8AB8|nr:nitrite reductase small subunit NirD [Marinobacter sp.]MDX1633669.1 nitrite reductase small subunit NirD [Marinobacter sp.]